MTVNIKASKGSKPMAVQTLSGLSIKYANEIVGDSIYKYILAWNITQFNEGQSNAREHKTISAAAICIPNSTTTASEHYQLA